MRQRVRVVAHLFLPQVVHARQRTRRTVPRLLSSLGMRGRPEHVPKSKGLVRRRRHHRRAVRRGVHVQHPGSSLFSSGKMETNGVIYCNNDDDDDNCSSSKATTN